MDMMQMMAMIRQSGNPQQFVMNMIQTQMGETPIGKNLLGMLQQNNSNGIETFARNLCQSRGIDFDTEFSNFRKQLGI